MKEYSLHKSFRKTFILKPEHLSKLDHTLKKLKASSTGFTLLYNVNRIDGTRSSYTSLQEVLEEPNISGRKIEAISLEISDISNKEENSLSGWIRFDADPSSETSVSISIYDSRPSPIDNSAASDLLPLLERCLTGFSNKRGVPEWLHAVILPTIVLVLSFIGAIKFIPSFSEKIGKLQFSTFIFQSIISVAVLVAVYSLCSTLELPKSWHRFFGKTPVFLWGDEVEAYRRREKIRSNVLWYIEPVPKELFSLVFDIC